MSLTSIGYGDITPQRMEEFIVCAICMLIGGFCWAYAIGNVSASLGANDPVVSLFREKYDSFNELMEKSCLPQGLRLRVRQYLRESQGMMRLQLNFAYMHLLGKTVRDELMQHHDIFMYVQNVIITFGLEAFIEKTKL